MPNSGEDLKSPTPFPPSADIPNTFAQSDSAVTTATPLASTSAYSPPPELAATTSSSATPSSLPVTGPQDLPEKADEAHANQIVGEQGSYPHDLEYGSLEEGFSADVEMILGLPATASEANKVSDNGPALVPTASAFPESNVINTVAPITVLTPLSATVTPTTVVTSFSTINTPTTVVTPLSAAVTPTTVATPISATITSTTTTTPLSTTVAATAAVTGGHIYSSVYPSTTEASRSQPPTTALPTTSEATISPVPYFVTPSTVLPGGEGPTGVTLSPEVTTRSANYEDVSYTLSPAHVPASSAAPEHTVSPNIVDNSVS